MDRQFSLDRAKSVVFLVAALVMITTLAVGATGWTKGINIITFVGAGSVLIGLMLARSVLPALVAHIFSIIIGIGWSFWVTSRLLPAHYTWLERWQNLAIRLQSWYEQALQGGTSYDNLMFILQMSVIVWGMGYLTIWFLFRSGKPWPAIVPGGVVLLINLYYAPRDITFWFILYVMIALLLVIRFNLFAQEQEWRSAGVFFRPDISFDFLRDGFIFSILVVVLAWLTPPVVDAKTLGLLDEFQGNWRDVQGEWNRLFADLNYRPQRVADTFGSSLTLGGPRYLTDDPVLDVRVDGVGRYWRAAVYDYYTGDGWLTTDEQTAAFGPDEPLPLPQFQAREPVTQTFTFYRDNATVLYAMSNPVQVDRSVRVTFNALAPEQVSAATAPTWSGEGPLVEEITYMRSNATVDQGESYQMVSAASRATISQLEQSGSDYPAWITDRYLQLPNTITERTRQLAQDLAEPFDNDFSQARAIERFLRAELEYNELLSTPPPGVDKVDYILFTAKEAYCDYYASSMIVMLRSLGIPARLAVGFARGTYDSDKDAFHVLNRDAHSWVEVYFPRYGWVEFEPTSAQPVILRPTETEDGSLAGGPLSDRPNPDELPDDPGNIPIDDELVGGGALSFDLTIPGLGFQMSVPRGAVTGGSFVLVALLLVGLVVGGLRWWRQQAQGDQHDAVTLYQQMLTLARWMGVSLRPWQTPYEQAAHLQRSLPAHRQEVETIADAYVVHTFSARSSAADNRRRVSVAALPGSQAWQRLWPAMLKAALWRRLPRWLRS